MHRNNDDRAADQADADGMAELWIDLGAIDDRLIRIERRLGVLLFLNGIALTGIITLLVLTWFS